MKILYGVQGTGHGHLVRSASMVRRLKELGHDVHCLISGRPPEQIAGVEQFEPYSTLRGFTGFAAGGKIKLVQSLAHLRIPRFFRSVREFDASGFDLVVTDYEPASGWIARRNKLPSIGLGHLYAFRRFLPLLKRTLPTQVLVGRFAQIYTPVARAIGLHWHHFGQHSLPPTISPEVYSKPEVESDKVLVYLPGENEDEMVALFNRFPAMRFVVYRPIEAPRERDNVLLKPYHRQGFLDDLADAASVITNAGFTLPSEALHLGRRLLAKPIRRHPEQFLNGYALRALGLGTVTHHRLTPELIESWLDTPPPPPMNYPDVTRHLVSWIDGGNWDRIDHLVRETWGEVAWSPA